MTLPLLVMVLACQSEPGPDVRHADKQAGDAQRVLEPADVDSLALARTRGAAQQVGKTLKGRVQEAMAAGGPSAAIDVCSVEAGQFTEKISKESGVTIGRSSLRLRNPKNAAPDWVAAWLNKQGERPAEGVEGIARIDSTTTEAAQRVARVLMPIAVEAPCLACHGAADTLDPDVSAQLARLYPDDAATGYALGDLRGALWAELPID